MDRREHGSQTAKNGFRNEEDIIVKFNNWQTDIEAKLWLKTMGYLISDIEFVKAVKIYGHKADVQVQITVKLKELIDVQNMQVKLVSNKTGFNQIDKDGLILMHSFGICPQILLYYLKDIVVRFCQ